MYSQKLNLIRFSVVTSELMHMANPTGFLAAGNRSQLWIIYVEECIGRTSDSYA